MDSVSRAAEQWIEQILGQIFLEHFVPRWERVAARPPGWSAMNTSEDTRIH